VRIEDIPSSQPQKGQVKLKVSVCGICGSDIHEYQAGPVLIPRSPHPLTGRGTGPVVLGHEFSGKVIEGNGKWKEGDRVTASALILCGECPYCKKGQYNMCLKLGSVGFASDGAFAEYVVVPEYSLHSLPDSVSDDMGAFVEPLAVAVRAIKRSRMEIGHSVCVIGAGPLGLLVLQVALSAGATQVFVLDPIEKRREVARNLGATAVFDPHEDGVGRKIAELTNGLRVDCAFECVGSQEAFDIAVKVTARRGVICMVGVSLHPIQVPFYRLWGHEKEITTITGYVDEFPSAISLLESGRVDVNPLITGRISLDDLVEKGFEELINHPDKHVKILVYPGDKK